MVRQIKVFEGNALALELTETFSGADVLLIEQLFDEKLKLGFNHVNILIKVKDLTILKHMDFKAFLQGEVWGIKHFSRIGRCAVVADSDLMKTIVNVESVVLRFFSNALEEKYFDSEHLDEALKFFEG